MRRAPTPETWFDVVEAEGNIPLASYRLNLSPKEVGRGRPGWNPRADVTERRPRTIWPVISRACRGTGGPASDGAVNLPAAPGMVARCRRGVLLAGYVPLLTSVVETASAAETLA
jgi:hypothetical protein